MSAIQLPSTIAAILLCLTGARAVTPEYSVENDSVPLKGTGPVNPIKSANGITVPRAGNNLKVMVKLTPTGFSIPR